MRRDPDPLAEERDEALKVERGVHHDRADIDLAVSVGVHDGDRRFPSIDHSFFFLRRVLVQILDFAWLTGSKGFTPLYVQMGER